MLVHPDFSQRALATADPQRWVASPQPGVQRLMLDRLGGERARATSLVRYAPGSVFPPHGHPGGEEILVLAGTFSDASGDHGPGCYLRNPPGSAHQPASAEGALIFVKLWQMPASDTRAVRIDTHEPAAWRREGAHQTCPLHAHGPEHVALWRLAPGERFRAGAAGGAELLVLDGELALGAQRLGALAWLRLPPGDEADTVAGPGGATLYRKTGHLAEPVGLGAAA
jgi:anti-sigma factor ChrR (cupin superfamily)